MSSEQVVVLAGGTGGAKLARGMADAIGAERLTVIANTGDDIEIYGGYVSPDPDLICFWLADTIDERGWGLRGDTFAVMEALRRTDDHVALVSLSRNFGKESGKLKNPFFQRVDPFQRLRLLLEQLREMMRYHGGAGARRHDNTLAGFENFQEMPRHRAGFVVIIGNAQMQCALRKLLEAFLPGAFEIGSGSAVEQHVV